MTNLATFDPNLATLNQIANHAADASLSRREQSAEAPNTVRTHRNAVNRFCEFVASVNATISCESLCDDLTGWTAIDYGLLEAFQAYLLQRNYSTTSTSVYMHSLKALAGRAHRAKVITTAHYQNIHNVKVVSSRKVQARITVNPKAKAKALTGEQLSALKDQPSTPEGWRNRLLVCLLFDHALRANEARALTLEDFSENFAVMTIYRKKTGTTQRHIVSRDVRFALMGYLACDNAPKSGILLRRLQPGRIKGDGSRRLADDSIGSERMLYNIVNQLGERVGIENLGTHAGRHTYATDAVNGGTSMAALMSAAGWTSADTALNYYHANELANKDVVLKR